MFSEVNTAKSVAAELLHHGAAGRSRHERRKMAQFIQASAGRVVWLRVRGECGTAGGMKVQGVPLGGRN